MGVSDDLIRCLSVGWSLATIIAFPKSGFLAEKKLLTMIDKFSATI